eukprot:gb/GFBE01010960.1/.p1 GENE.gb/GFBE01010960.1/~~gb/GFBE01010960.1/.p1  ORF type:complete len:260 (+),score=40.80 gb/GFBE01010960.1/:1-780(+)
MAEDHNKQQLHVADGGVHACVMVKDGRCGFAIWAYVTSLFMCCMATLCPAVTAFIMFDGYMQGHDTIPGCIDGQIYLSEHEWMLNSALLCFIALYLIHSLAVVCSLKALRRVCMYIMTMPILNYLALVLLAGSFGLILSWVSYATITVRPPVFVPVTSSLVALSHIFVLCTRDDLQTLCTPPLICLTSFSCAIAAGVLAAQEVRLVQECGLWGAGCVTDTAIDMAASEGGEDLFISILMGLVLASWSPHLVQALELASL